MGLGGPQDRHRQRVQVGQALCQVHQHVDVGHHLPPGRVHGRPQEDPRGPTGNGGPPEMGGAVSGDSADSPEKSQPGRTAVPILLDAGPRDRGYVSLFDAGY